MNRRVLRVLVSVVLVGAALAGCGSSSAHASGPVTIRFGVIVSGGGAELPQTLISTGIAAKFGLRIKIVAYATPGQQYTLLRGHAADIVPGNVLDLERQRRAGLGIKAIAGFQRFSSPIVVQPDSSLRSFVDLRGRRFGQFGPTTIDWLAIRAAGRLATGFDVADAQLTQSSPALLSALLHRGRIDAAMQFASLAVGPVAQHRERVLTSVPALLRAAHLDADALDVVWDLSDSWRSAHPGALEKLRSAMAAAYARLKTGDPALWKPFTKLVGITDPATAKAFAAEEIANIDPPFDRALLAPTQRLVDAIVSVAGTKAVGVTSLPAKDFLFPK